MTNKRFVVFDVETPNFMNSRMSSIGICVVEKGIITEEYSTLINPEQDFDLFNIQLTGITPEMVEGAPNFKKFWDEFQPVLTSGVLVAHNAAFDMSVLAKCIDDYEIDCSQYASYACTCRMARRYFHCLPDNRLNTICDYLGIELNHHEALSDSRAAANILIHYLNNGLNVDSFIKLYDFYAKRKK